MPTCYDLEPCADSIAIVPLTTDALDAWLDGQDESVRRWVRSSGFGAQPHSTCLIPGDSGTLHAVLVGSPTMPLWTLASLPANLPEGHYHLHCDWPDDDQHHAAIGWGLGAYQFSAYKKPKRQPARLQLPAVCDAAEIERQVAAVYLARDLINMPAADLMPAELTQAVKDLGDKHAAEVEVITGEALLERNFPAIHAVGRASEHAPRLADLRWGDPSHPKVTLVGKGVCFDSGGLDLKPSKGMRLMKKDMGGAAHAIAVADLIMGAGLPVRLRLLIPAVENAVAGNAYRPGDVLQTRAGLTVEIDNTDAEGRVILCDTLAEACSETPQVLIDFATLTGAARVAVGTELPAMFCNDDDMAQQLRAVSVTQTDEVWQLPLHAEYRDMIDSKVADMVNSAPSPYGGAITAALFLQAFVAESVSWAHFDVMAWNLRARPGRPAGGEAMGVRAVYCYLAGRFGN